MINTFSKVERFEINQNQCLSYVLGVKVLGRNHKGKNKTKENKKARTKPNSFEGKSQTLNMAGERVTLS